MIKKKILHKAKTKFFYQILLNLIKKTFKTFSLPSDITFIDKNFYYLDLNNLNNVETFKYGILLKKKLLELMKIILRKRKPIAPPLAYSAA